MHTNGHASTRWMAVGHAGDEDAYSAGRNAAAQALQREDAKLLTIFCDDTYDLDALVRGVADAAPDVPLVGCSTAGQISSGGPSDASVVVAALGGEGFAVATAVARNAPDDLREAGAQVSSCAAILDSKPHGVILLLSDALGGDQQELLRGVYGELGAEVPLVGGCAGDGLKMKQTFQFYGGEVLRDALVAAAIASDAPLGIGVRHGWTRVGEPVLVTRSGGNKVYELEGRPALDVYLERHAVPEAVRIDEAAFNQFTITHPLGLSRRSGEDSVRMVAGADFAERTLNMIAEVPQGGEAWFMEGDVRSVLEATDAACTTALEALGGQAPLGVLTFDCAARRGVLGDDGIQREVAQVAGHAGAAPVAGFYSYGEIARTSGMSGFHNQTLVVLAVA